MADHAKFSPSKMQRIIACPGSVALESAFPDSRSSYADEGTVAHFIAALCLQEKEDARRYAGVRFNVSATGETSVAREGKFLVDDEFAAYVQTYIDSVRRMAHGKILLVEQRVEFSRTVDVPNQYGTSDVIIIDVENRLLIVIDLKFGMGVKVYAEGNEQALSYAVAVLETFDDILPEIDKVQLVISQPRLDHEDLWECSISEVHAHAGRMKEAISKAQCGAAMYADDKAVPEVYFKAGDKQCKFCKAKAICPTLAASVAQAVTGDFAVFNTTESINKVIAGPPLRAPGADVIGARYGMLDLIEEWVKATRAEVERMVFAGMTVIGPDQQPMKLGEGKKGNRAWSDEEKAEAMLTGHLPPEKAYQPRKIITASAAAKLLDKKATAATWANFKALITQAPGRPTVMLGSDPRPTYKGEAQACEFEDLSGDPTL